jgi:Amt family ammonium transporter
MTHQQLIDSVWILLCAALVFTMQAGFMCLETGLVRAKNSINVAMKNLVDLCVSGAVFWLFGYGLMFGSSHAGLIGTGHFLFDGRSAALSAFFVFQMMFCSTSATIVSGAVAERMRFFGYFLTTLVISSVIYPVIGHWAWGGAAEGRPSGWLATAGFIDFAGSTVVHSVGGWVALAAVLLIGPREGRFGGVPIKSSNLPMSTLGVFLLWFGWFGFNGGSTLAVNDQIPGIILNTTLAGLFGGLAGLLTSHRLYGYFAVEDTINGVIAGLVGITASCHIQTPVSAVLIGSVAGVIVVLGARWLAERRVDDSVGAIPAHLFAGIWGTLAVALFAPAEVFAEHGRWHQLLVQATGIVAAGAYAFGGTYLCLAVLNRFYRFRADPAAERMGLNVAEHAANTAILDLLTEMENQRLAGDFSKPVSVEPHTEVGQIARQYNEVLTRVNEEIHHRESTLQALRLSEARKTAILDAALDCIITINYAGKVIEFNPAAERTFGYPRSRLLGKNLAYFIIPPEGQGQFEENLNEGFVTERGLILNRRCSLMLTRAHGEQFPAEVAITRVLRGREVEYTLHIRDVTKHTEIQKRLTYLANCDHLTGLANRSYFRHTLEAFIESALHPKSLILLFLDLDRFKTVNDTLGHEAGDELLKTVAYRLRSVTRSDDLVCRWGGDEFVVAVFGGYREHELVGMAQRYISVLGEPVILNGKPIRTPTSIGIARYPDNGRSADILIRNADLALYEAKRVGRNNYQFFTSEFERKWSEHFYYEAALRDALKQGEFELYYQPQVDCRTKAVVGVEALLRWHHPEQGLIPPCKFIPILEEIGINEVGEWVLMEACKQQRRWVAAGFPELRLAVNVSIKQFRWPGFVGSVSRIIEETGIDPARLELEITESVLASDTDYCIRTLKALTDLGIQIAIDDFGTGYSSLSYLKRFPINVLKIDRTFIIECHTNSEDAAICSAIVSLAKSLGLKTIAEGIETEGQLAFIADEGCDYFQGYLFSPAVPAPEFAERCWPAARSVRDGKARAFLL